MAKEERLRSDIEEKYKWDLTGIYSSEEAFENDKNKLKEKLNKIDTFREILTKDANTLYEFLKFEEEIDVLVMNLYVYASAKKDEDVSDSKSQKNYNEILDIYSIYGEKTSFVVPELLKTKYDVIKKYINEDKRLKEYEFDLEQIYRYQPYVLSEKEEILLSNIGDLQNRFSSNFDIALYSLVDYGYIKDEEGKKVKLTNSNYSKYAKSPNRRVRKSAFEGRYKNLKKFTPLIATDYIGSVKADAYIAKAKKYDSTLDMYLFPDGVTPKIYDTLLKVADDNLHILHKYFDMIKKVLKLKVLNDYDLNTSLVKEEENKYTPEKARELIINALSVYGEEYTNILTKAFDEKWIDFYSNKGKYSGWYCNKAVKSHPIVLGNFNNDYNSVSSLSHELGHAVQSYYSYENNKPHLAEYTIFVAEVASLANEILLSSYIVKNSNDKNEKLIALDNILGVFAGNFFGTLSEGAIFEKKVHDISFNSGTLSETTLNEIFGNIRKRYLGNNVKNSGLSDCRWAMVSHFYSPFYYYKYSIGVCGACYVAKKILSGDKQYLNKYLDYLKLGGSMMPLDELKKIDLDFTDTKVIEEGINYFNELIDEFITIYNS